jgi:hypothetical protein
VLVTLRAGRAVSGIAQSVAAERPEFAYPEERVLAR